MQVLEEKSGQRISFATVEERDAWIQKTVAAKEATKAGNARQLADLEAQCRELNQQLAAIDQVP